MMWLTLLLLILCTLFYFKLKKTFTYWEVKGVPHIRPLYIFGNLLEQITKSNSPNEIIESIYYKFYKHRYIGFYLYNQPTLIIRDPELIKQILLKDFEVFPDHQTTASPDIDPLWGKNLFQISAKNGWQSLRAILSPSFTSSKLKIVFELIQECGKQFVDYFQKYGQIVPINTKDVFTRYTNDVIATTAFGVTCDSLKYNNNEFYLMGKEISDFSGLKRLKFFIYSLSPTLMKLSKMRIINNKVGRFFSSLISETIKIRLENNIIRPDMIHLLLEARKAQQTNINSKVIQQATELNDENITAQALLFFLAGFETSSSALSFIVYDLAINPNIQQKLYAEIIDTLNNSDLTYDILFSMKYLDCVVSESLRLHAPVPIIDRKCVKPYTINAVLPMEKPVHVDKGTIIWFPIHLIQNDEQYFPDPTKFDPERFNDENKSKIRPYTYFPFGAGPRFCIGNRFGLMEIKLVVVEILKHFEIVPNEKTEIPLKATKYKNLNGLSDGNIWVSFKPRL